MKLRIKYLAVCFLVALIMGLGLRNLIALEVNAYSNDQQPSINEASSSTATQTQSNNQPQNVLVLIADDYGIEMSAIYTDAANLPPTPNLQALADNGIVFKNAWVYPICSPTRASILTGRYGFRTGIGDVVSNSDAGISLTEQTIPKALTAGSPLSYTHANIGKWHLSTQNNGRRQNPNLMGYDHFSGLLQGGLPSYYTYTKVVNGSNVSVNNYATTETVNDAISWLNTQLAIDKPWFLWVAFNAPHTPFHLPPTNLHSFDTLSGDQSDIDANPYDYYKASVEAMDTEIGRLISAIPTDVLSNTTIIFLGDNGSPASVVQGGLPNNHAKGSLFDGGVNVPFLISGGQVVNPGRESDALVNGVDVFATTLELMGVNISTTIPATVTLDSVSLMPYITDSQTSRLRHWIFTEKFNPAGGNNLGKTLRDHRYKLLRFDNGNESLYDLLFDPKETTDLLATGNPLTFAEELSYCVLYEEMIELLSSEPGVSVPTLPASCPITTFTFDIVPGT